MIHLDGSRQSCNGTIVRYAVALAGLLGREIDARYDDAAPQAGAALAVCAECETGCILGAGRAGAPGRPSEAIAEKVAHMLLADLGSGATVDRHLADQLVLSAALADGTSEYIIPGVKRTCGRTVGWWRKS
jgi:RNA 3'-terminal phosphate cyclase (ATP)